MTRKMSMNSETITFTIHNSLSETLYLKHDIYNVKTSISTICSPFKNNNTLTLNFQITFKYIWVTRDLSFYFTLYHTSNGLTISNKKGNIYVIKRKALTKNNDTLRLSPKAMTMVYNMNPKWYVLMLV